MEKKNTGLIITIVVLVVLLFGLFGYVCYDKLYLEKRDDDSSSNIDNTSKAESDNGSGKKYILSNSDLRESKLEYHIYAISSNAQIIAYNGEMYIVFNHYENNPSDYVNDCLSNAKFNDNKYVCKSNSDETKNNTIIKTNIKESEVYAASLSGSSLVKGDAKYYSFIIYNNGKVKAFLNEDPLNDVFKSYKVKNVHVYCAKEIDDIGSCKWEYKLSLKDGNTKILENVE